MDHKGPERHYDENESPETGRAIGWQQGEIAPDHVNIDEKDYDLRSPSGGRPYRGQPSPTESDMTERNTPLDGSSKDQGGNPLMEGILASKKEDEEELEELNEATEPKGLGDTNPVKDHDWKSGDISDRSMGRDEMLGSVRKASEDEEELWDEVVEDFEEAEGGETEDPTEKVAAASWLENDGQDSNVPVEHLGWDIVDVVEPSKEYTEAANKYTMPLPQGITDNLHEALIKLNAWVENPEENGRLRPYKDYWSVIRPKVSSDSSVQIGVQDPHMADIINHVARTDDSSVLNKTASEIPVSGISKGVEEFGQGAKGVKNLAAPGENTLNFIINKIPGLPDSLKDPLKKAIILFNPEIWPEIGREELMNMGIHLMEGKCPICSSIFIGVGQPGKIGVSSAALNINCPACQGTGTRDGFIETVSSASIDSVKSVINKVVEEKKNPQHYRVVDPLKEGPMEKIPISPAEKQLEDAIDAELPPSGYRANPSGHGEPVGTRGPDGRILPREQQQPASDQTWNDPNLENAPTEWETELGEDPNAYGVPQNEQQQQPPKTNPGGLGLKGIIPAGAAALGVAGADVLKKAITPPTMPDYSMIRNTSVEESNIDE